MVNPILDTALEGHKSFSFAPCSRIVYSASNALGFGLELYENFGPVGSFAKTSEQQQTLFAVIDLSARPGDLELGVGHGFTRANSDALVLKLIFTPRLQWGSPREVGSLSP